MCASADAVHVTQKLADEAPAMLGVAQDAPPNGKKFLFQMIRRQVAMKQREAKAKAEHKPQLHVHIMRSYKQVLADERKHPASKANKSRLKALASAKLRKAKALLEKQAHMSTAGDNSAPVELMGADAANPIALQQQQPPPAYQFTPLQTVPQYQAQQSMPPPQGYAQPPQYAQQPPPEQEPEAAPGYPAQQPEGYAPPPAAPQVCCSCVCASERAQMCSDRVCMERLPADTAATVPTELACRPELAVLDRAIGKPGARA